MRCDHGMPTCIISSMSAIFSCTIIVFFFPCIFGAHLCFRSESQLIYACNEQCIGQIVL